MKPANLRLMARTGKPRPRVLDEKKIIELASILCTSEEIATIMDCSKDLLERRYMHCLKKGRANGRMSVRRQQFRLLMEGNATMGVWLGKIILGQVDKQEIEKSDKGVSDVDRALLVEFAKKSMKYFEEKE